MRMVRYGGAMSLDGYIAGPQGEYDWIVQDPEMDFATMMAGFDTFLIGRKTFDMMVRAGREKPLKGIEYVVFSRTLKAQDYPQVRVEREAEPVVKELRAKAGKSIALFGGGELFRSLLHAVLVDRVEVSLVPVLLGGAFRCCRHQRNGRSCGWCSSGRMRRRGWCGWSTRLSGE